MATFHLFPRFPAEIRLQIWEMTVEPRIVKVGFRSKGRYPQRFTFLDSPTPVPAPLQTCRESRNAGLYQRCFSDLSDLFNREESQLEHRRYAWCNLDIDMIDIGEKSLRAFRLVAHLIKRLKFKREYDEWWVRGDDWSNGSELLRFENATEIHVVLSENDCFESWHGTSWQEPWACVENVLFIDEVNGEEMWLMDLEYQYDREFEKRCRDTGWKGVYCCGEMLADLGEDIDFRASDYHRSLYYYSLT